MSTEASVRSRAGSDTPRGRSRGGMPRLDPRTSGHTTHDIRVTMGDDGPDRHIWLFFIPFQMYAICADWGGASGSCARRLYSRRARLRGRACMHVAGARPSRMLRGREVSEA